VFRRDVSAARPQPGPGERGAAHRAAPFSLHAGRRSGRGWSTRSRYRSRSSDLSVGQP